jgi:hypothetical protein
MASDRGQFNRALRKWIELHDGGERSMSVQAGRVAILASGYALGETSQERNAEKKYFKHEAHTLQRNLELRGINSVIRNRFTYDDAVEVIQDHTVSSIITIGNGTLSSVWIAQHERLDWIDVGNASTHLKTGLFIQRHCGHFVRELSVPLGTFAISRHSNVLAARDYYLPTEMSDEDEHRIQTLHPLERLDYRTVKSLFPYTKEDKDDLPSES